MESDMQLPREHIPIQYFQEGERVGVKREGGLCLSDKRRLVRIVRTKPARHTSS